MNSFYDKQQDAAFQATFKRETPDILQAFGAFNQAVFAPEGREIPLKYRELIALAVGITTQCVYCIDSHAAGATHAGATDGEIAEASWVATAIRAGGGFAHSRLAMRLADESRPVEGHSH